MTMVSKIASVELKSTLHRLHLGPPFSSLSWSILSQRQRRIFSPSSCSSAPWRWSIRNGSKTPLRLFCFLFLAFEYTIAIVSISPLWADLAWQKMLTRRPKVTFPWLFYVIPWSYSVPCRKAPYLFRVILSVWFLLQHPRHPSHGSFPLSVFRWTLWFSAAFLTLLGAIWNQLFRQYVQRYLLSLWYPYDG